MTPMSAAARRPGPTADPDQRAELLAAAARLLAAEGPGALTVRRIAAEAGCSTMGVYSRFGGKDGIVDALFIDGFRGLEAAMAAATPGTGDPADELLACGRAYRRFALDHPTSYAVMFERAIPGFEPSDDAVVIAAHTFELLQTAVGRAMAGGLIRDADPAEGAQRLWAMCHGWVSLEVREMLKAGEGDEGYERALRSAMAPVSSARSTGGRPSRGRAPTGRG